MKQIQGKIYIIGAGFAGKMICREIKEKGIFGEVAAFLDDDTSKIGTKISGIPVIGPVMEIIPVLKHEAQDEALIAIPSAEKAYLSKLYTQLKKSGFHKIKILPGISQIIEGDAHLVQAREIDPQDLLGRDPQIIGLKESIAYLRGKRVLITGAGGSIGSELARQLLSGGAQRLYLFGHGENSIYQIERELKLLQQGGVGESAVLVPVIGDIKDREFIFYILNKLKADVIFHCAAYKHVPLMEANPVAAIENNVFGTKNLLDGALESGVKRFVLISTDKAVSPVSVYGASKALCEELILHYAKKAGENQSFMSVRFGNVLGSRGSVLPLFLDQISQGGPLTVTHKDMERYFMTIPEACSLVLKAGGVGENGKMYLLDMGEPLKIYNIALQLIRFYGFEPDKDIKIKIIGTRPGERLTEPLWLKEENPVPTSYPGILDLKDKKQSVDIEKVLGKLADIVLSGNPGTDYEKSYQEENFPFEYRNKEKLKQILIEFFPSLTQTQTESVV